MPETAMSREIEIPVVRTSLTEDDAISMAEKRRFPFTRHFSIFYPLYAYRLTFSLRRLLMEPRGEDVFVIVDAVRRASLLADSFPTLDLVTCREDSVIPPSTTEGEAEELAVRKGLKRIKYRFPLWRLPDVKVAERRIAYKRYWIFRGDGEGADAAMIVDTFHNKVEVVKGEALLHQPLRGRGER